MSLNWVGSLRVRKRGHKLLKLTRFSPTWRHLMRLVITLAPCSVGWEDITLDLDCILSNCTHWHLILMYYKCEYLRKNLHVISSKDRISIKIYIEKHQHVFILMIKTDLFYILFISIIYLLEDFSWSSNQIIIIKVYLFIYFHAFGKEENQLKLVKSWVISYLSRFNLALSIWDSLISPIF